jgi:AcrR family transcriptional regulator
MNNMLLNEKLKAPTARSIAKTSRYKPQARTGVMKSRILDAAQQVFAERGFDNSNLDLVAAQAGCSRGAIYAHYVSKDEVFLELFQHRIAALFAECCRELENEPDLRARVAIFRTWILDQFFTPTWGILTLEFKLYAIRHPEIRTKLMSIYDSLGDSPSDFRTLLLGSHHHSVELESLRQRLTVLSSLLSGLSLEHKLRPELFTQGDLQALVEEIFESFFASHVLAP